MAVTSPLIRRPSATTRRLFVLAGGTFVFVTTETQPIALLTPMAHGLGVSESSVGLLMTAYAAVAALTAIPLTIFASRIPRRGLVIATVSILVVSQLGLALAPSYAVALGARLLGALAHGVFWSVIAQVAATLVSRDRIGRATASEAVPLERASWDAISERVIPGRAWTARSTSPAREGWGSRSNTTFMSLLL